MVVAGRRNLVAGVVMTALASALTACSGGGSADGGAKESGGAHPVGTGYTSEQLRQALPTDFAGYRRAGEPDAGEYASLSAVRNYDQLQRQITLSKPKCANASRIGGLDTAPSSLAVFAKPNGQSVSTVLIAVPAPTAEQQLRVRVPSGCRSFRSKVGGQWSEHEIVEARGSAHVGLGSRTVGVTTITGSAAVKTWYVLVRGRGYLGTITLYGPNVTRTEAEQLAKATYEHAERILP